MKKTFLIFSLMSLFILVTAFQCEVDDRYTLNCERNLESLSAMRAEIQAIANTSICGEDFACRYIAFGSKPCGGPWEYLIYSTSIDTLNITALMERYNAMETEYNVNCNPVSDCSTPQPPFGFSCENNQCIPIYE